MANRRMLSKRISLSAKFNKLSRCSQVLYLMQTPYLDDYGNYTADVEDIKAEVLPKNIITIREIGNSLAEMNEIGIIKLYSVDGKEYQHYTSFEKFQSFRSDRPRNHDYPEYNDNGIPLTTTDIPWSTPSKVKLREVKLREEKKNTSAQDLHLANLLLDLIKENNPNFKQPNINKWADEVRKMRELDKRDEKLIKAVIRWCQASDFWKANILSTKKLREKFDQLYAQAKRDFTSNKMKVA